MVYRVVIGNKVAISFIVAATIGALCIFIAKLIEEKKQRKLFIEALQHIIKVQKVVMTPGQLEQIEFILKSKQNL